MNCEDCCEKLTFLIFDELPEAEEMKVHEHIAECSSCMEEYIQLMDVESSLEGALTDKDINFTLGEDRVAEVMKQAKAADEEAARDFQSATFKQFPVFITTLAACIVISFVWYLKKDPESGRDLARTEKYHSSESAVKKGFGEKSEEAELDEVANADKEEVLEAPALKNNSGRSRRAEKPKANVFSPAGNEKIREIANVVEDFDQAPQEEMKKKLADKGAVVPADEAKPESLALEDAFDAEVATDSKKALEEKEATLLAKAKKSLKELKESEVEKRSVEGGELARGDEPLKQEAAAKDDAKSETEKAPRAMKNKSPESALPIIGAPAAGGGLPALTAAQLRPLLVAWKEASKDEKVSSVVDKLSKLKDEEIELKPTAVNTYRVIILKKNEKPLDYGQIFFHNGKIVRFEPVTQADSKQ